MYLPKTRKIVVIRNNQDYKILNDNFLTPIILRELLKKNKNVIKEPYQLSHYFKIKMKN
jgi:hypothetical protein